jgi:hypothetical protein
VLGHILETAFSDICLNILDPTIMIMMVSGTSAILAYRTKIGGKYKYVILLGFIVAVLVTSWTYATIPVPPESYDATVVIWVFFVRLLAAMIWGSCSWGVHRAFLNQGDADRPAHPPVDG